MKPLSLLFPLFLIFIISGCATTYKVDQALVDQFEYKSTVTPDKTGVYLIRGDNFQGAARSAWVAANESVVAKLPNASHTYLELDNGLNTIHLVQSMMGFGYITVDNLPGETVFLAVDYATGRTTRVDDDLGKTMVMKTKEIPPLEEKRENAAYDNALINPSLLGLAPMTYDAKPLEANQEMALVTIYRPGKFLPTLSFDVWNQDGYLGALDTMSYFQAYVPAGKHTFVARSERYSFVEAEFEAGKEYAIELSVNMGWNQAHVKLLPVDLREPNNDTTSWKSNSKLLGLNTETINGENLAPRLAKGKSFLSNVFLTSNSEEIEKRSLPSNFGI